MQSNRVRRGARSRKRNRRLSGMTLIEVMIVMVSSAASGPASSGEPYRGSSSVGMMRADAP
jgi:hypothetical protein